MKLLLLLFLQVISIQVFGSPCERLANVFLTSGLEAKTYAYSETLYADAVIEVEYQGKVLGEVIYSSRVDDVYIELVRVNENYRRDGVHTRLLEKLVNKTNPNKIALTYGDSNKELFLNAVGGEFFPSHQGYKPDMAEWYLVQHIHTGLIDGAAVKRGIFEAPTGRALKQLGYSNVDYALSTYTVNEKRKLRIALNFTRE